MLGKLLSQLALQLVVQHVALADGQNVLLVHQLRIVLLQLAAQGPVLRRDVVRVGGHEEEQDGIAFDVTEEPKSESLAFRGTFNDARNVRHHKALFIAVRDHAEVGAQGGERVVRDFRLGGTDHTEKRGLAGIGEAHQPHVGEQLQFNNLPLFKSVFAWLGVARSLVGGRLEMVVPKAAAAAGGGDDFLAVFRDLCLDLSRFRIFDEGAERHLNDGILAVRAVTTVARAGFAVGGDDVALVFEVQERPQLTVPANDHVPTTAAISPVWTALRGGLVAVHVR